LSFNRASFKLTQNISGDIYEHAVVLSVKLEDQDAFERDFCQLKPYYMDTWFVSCHPICRFYLPLLLPWFLISLD
jgi:hypothetical protein